MNCTEEHIIELIEKDEAQKEGEAVRCLYHNCGSSASSVLISNGAKDAAERKSFILLAIVTFFIQVRNGKFQLTGQAKICTYLIEIARRLWLKHWHKEDRHGQIQEVPATDTEKDKEAEERKKKQLEAMKKAIESLSATDQEIIRAIYYQGMDLEEFAAYKKFKSSAARARLARARIRIRNHINTQS